VTERSIAQLADLSGRVAVVTGAAGRIGRVISSGLAELGATVVVVDRDGETCDLVAQQLRDTSENASFGLEANLEDEASTRRIPELVIDQVGRIDVLVHMAALVSAEPLPNWTSDFESQSAETWRRALEVNLTSVFNLTQVCTPALRSSGRGSVITVGSTYGLVGPDWRIYEGTSMGNAAGYAASKGGILQLTRWLATTLAPSIRVNSLTPGGVERRQPSSFVEAYEQRTPLQRMAQEEDFKGAIAFLASDLSAYVTGQNIVVDGGWTAW
jgi:NAD(P)-dependent dehydrogenase (short-subunit alcohol dehydrogenase family)